MKPNYDRRAARALAKAAHIQAVREERDDTVSLNPTKKRALRKMVAFKQRNRNKASKRKTVTEIRRELMA